MKYFLFLSSCVFFFHASSINATEHVPDKFRIAVGGYLVTKYDSSVSLTEPNLGTGISISPEDTLGLDSKQTVLRVDGHYRFNQEHALTYSWYRISSSGNKIIATEFSWLDENGDEITVPVGANVDSNLKYDIFKLGYLWSFYHSDKIELAAGAGIHFTRIALGVEADTTSSGFQTEDVKVSAPLPVFALALKYNVTPKLSWALKSEVFSLSYDDYEGTYTDATFVLEYRAWKNIGLGFGLGTNELDITETTPSQKLNYNNRITGVNVYLSAYF